MTAKELDKLLTYEVLVDCYNEWEIAAAWNVRAEGYLHFPFKAKLENKNVEVVSLDHAGEEEQNEEYEEGYEDEPIGVSIWVNAVEEGKEMEISVPLEDLKEVDADEETLLTIALWKHFLGH